VEMAGRAREFALQYDIDLVVSEFMLPALREAADRFGLREPIEIEAAA